MSREASAADHRRAVASAALLSSDMDGEALAATRALCRQLSRLGLDPATVIGEGLSRSAPVPAAPRFRSARVQPVSVTQPHQRTAMMARAFPELLNDWERSFLDSIAGQRSITDRQLQTLHGIASKIERGRK